MAFPGVEIVRTARKDVKEKIASGGGRAKSCMLRKLGLESVRVLFQQ